MGMKVYLCAVRAPASAIAAPRTVGGVACHTIEMAPRDGRALIKKLGRKAKRRAVVAIALDGGAVTMLRAAGEAIAGLVAVRDASGAEAVVRLLAEGRSPASIIHPPLFNPDRLVASAASGAERWGVEISRAPAALGEPWMRLGVESVTVAAKALPPRVVSAIGERTGLAKVPSAEGEGRLLIAPANWAGQGRAWAEAVTRYVPGFTAQNLAVRHTDPPRMLFGTDVLVDATAWQSPVTRLDIALDLVLPSTHVLVEDLRCFLGANAPRGFPTGPAESVREVEQILASGRQAAVLIHGSAARHPAAHAALYPASPFRDRDDAFTIASANKAEAMTAAAASLNLPTYVATLDMLDFVEGATWLPIVISPQDFASAPPWEPAGRLKVAHIPSAGVFKGSAHVDRILQRLDQAGLIEYVRLGGVHPLLMASILRRVDVVIDQVVLGNPATLMNQTLAAGRLAVGHIAPHVRRRYPMAPPVLEADPSTLEDVIAQVALDPQAYQATAEAGPAFARELHDGRLAAKVLADTFLNGQ